MMKCRHCHKALPIDRREDPSEVLLQLTQHQLDECTGHPRWVQGAIAAHERQLHAQQHSQNGRRKSA